MVPTGLLSFAGTHKPHTNTWLLNSVSSGPRPYEVPLTPKKNNWPFNFRAPRTVLLWGNAYSFFIFAFWNDGVRINPGNNALRLGKSGQRGEGFGRRGRTGEVLGKGAKFLLDVVTHVKTFV